MDLKVVLETYFPKVIGAIIVLVLGFVIAKMITGLIGKIIKKSELDELVQSFLKHLIGIILKIIVLITAAGVLGIPIGTFMVVLGSAGLAVGLALKDSLSNFAGGVLLLVARPFDVGDFIEYGGSVGTVDSIKILYTTLSTPDNRKIIIPNGHLSNAQITNFSVEKNRRVDLTFGIGYEQDFEKAKQVIFSIIKENQLILKDLQPLVRVGGHGASSIDIDVKVWCEGVNYWTVYYDLHEEIKKRFDVEKISIPFPQMDVHLVKEPQA